MFAKYILRLDDACPTMDRDKWDRLEELLRLYNIKPIVSVIPKNEDENLKLHSEDKFFWKKVKQWELDGWSIALHGYEHLYKTNEAGLVPINHKSEFSGLAYEIQRKKITSGFKIFQENNINCKIWVAPGHSFDKNTIKALLDVTNIRIISDGIAFKQYYDLSMYWIPQQLWKARKMLFGTWTICLHPSTMTEYQFQQLESFLKDNYSSFENVELLVFSKRKKNIFEKVFEKLYWLILDIKHDY